MPEYHWELDRMPVAISTCFFSYFLLGSTHQWPKDKCKSIFEEIRAKSPLSIPSEVAQFETVRLEDVLTITMQNALISFVPVGMIFLSNTEYPSDLSQIPK